MSINIEKHLSHLRKMRDFIDNHILINSSKITELEINLLLFFKKKMIANPNNPFDDKYINISRDFEFQYIKKFKIDLNNISLNDFLYIVKVVSKSGSLSGFKKGFEIDLLENKDLKKIINQKIVNDYSQKLKLSIVNPLK